MEYFYAPPECFTGHRCVIEGEEFAHLTHVMRRKVGDALRIVDGAGNAYDAVIESLAARRASCRITAKHGFLHEPRTRVTLAVALLKNPSRYDTLVEKGTELGVAAFAPLLTERTISRHGRTDRWSKIALAAMKQSGRCVLPQILPPQPFAEFVAAAPGTALRLLAHEEAGGDPFRGLPSTDSRAEPRAEPLGQPHEVLACIGPEGGFTSDEAELAASAGFQTVSLGSRRLRTETAAIFLAGLLLLET